MISEEYNILSLTGMSKKRYRGRSLLDQVFLYPSLNRLRNLFFSGVRVINHLKKSPNFSLQSPLTPMAMTHIKHQPTEIILNSNTATFLVKNITFLAQL